MTATFGTQRRVPWILEAFLPQGKLCFFRLAFFTFLAHKIPIIKGVTMSDENSEDKTAFEEQVKSNVQNKNTWLRLFFLALFAVIYYVVFFVAIGVGFIQFVAGKFSGKPLSSLQEFNATLADYSRELVAYITYASDKKPFPFKE
jgi:hypothetical protein